MGNTLRLNNRMVKGVRSVVSGTDSAHGGSDNRLRRDIGRVGLLFTSVGSIIGSGWLFGALYAVQEAGPAAIFSWLIGAVFVLFIALVYAELAPMFPYAGGVVRYPHYTHGGLVSFSAGWFSWLHVTTTPAIEVIAALQYASNYLPWLTKNVGGNVVLTGAGFGVAAAGLLLFAAINVLGVRWFARVNTPIVWWKLGIIVLVVVTLLVSALEGTNYTELEGGFAPYGVDAVFSAIASAGIVFSYLGFRQAIELAGEGRNPQRTVPFAVIGSILITALIYIGLQIAFIGAVPTEAVADGGWANLSFANDFGPLAGVAALLGLAWLAILLYIDAVVSPSGTGLIYMTVSARVSYGMSRNRNAPRPIAILSSRGVPWVAILVTFVVGLIIMLPFSGWQQLVGFVTSTAALSFATGAPTLLVLRRHLPQRHRPFRLPAATLIAFLAFYAANLFVFWNGWSTNWRMFAALGVGMVLFVVQYYTRRPDERPRLDVKQFSWLLPWLAGLALISALGEYGGGLGLITFVIGFPTVAVWSAFILWWAVAVGAPREQIERNIVETAGPGEEGSAAEGT